MPDPSVQGLLDMFKYPAVGFHFAVVFELFPQTPNDLRFQEVTGLGYTMDTEPYSEGGENRFVHEIPGKPKYQQLELKRGMFIGSGIVAWAKMAIEYNYIKPTNVIITLLNDLHLPVAGWYVVNAYPVGWSLSDLNAQESKAAIESIQLKYNYFKTIRI